MTGEIELAALVQVTAKAGFRRFARIDDGMGRPARFRMQTAGAMTRFATNLRSIDARRFKLRVSGRMKCLGNFLVTLGARFAAHESGARNVRRRDHHPAHRHA